MSAILKIILFAVLAYYGAKAQISATDWDSISPNLVQYFSAQLPTPPSNAINIANPGALGEPNPFFTMTVDFTHSAPLDTCGQSQPISNWPSKAAELGSKDHGGFCRIQFYSSEYEFRCKNSTANSAPVSADPAWVQMRFPVLPKQDYGEPRSIFFKFDPRNSYYGFNAFGGNPCAAANVTPSYECRLNIVGPWDRRVPSGYYVLFTTPGAQGYIVTGPHRFYPQGRVDIPDQLRTADIEELDVVFMTFNQYPVTAECPSSGACNVGQYRLLLLNSVTLETGIDLTFSRDPPTAHPRLFGTDSDFLTNKVDPFLNLPCDNSVTGQLVNVRRAFENGFLGGNSCQKTIPTSLYNHTLAKKYFDMELPSFNQGTRYDEGRKIMFLIRYLRACHKLNRQNCLFPSSEVEALVPKVIQREFSYWASWNWDNNYGGYAGTEYIQFGYDLGTTPTFIFWSTFVDTFWNDIDTTTRTTIETQFDVIIFNFRRLIDLQLWPMWNGNNWTPFLSTPIGYWGIAYWHEHDQATETVQMMLRAMFLHRRMFLDDGVYQEGMSYVGMSMDSMMELDFVLFAGTGTHIDSMRWDRIAILHRWMNDGMLGDGSSMDFGDANVLVGFSSLLSLYSMYIDEVMDRGTSVVDPCQLKQFWTNKYFEAGFDDPWGLHKSMARNWTNLVIQCTSQAPLLQPQVTVYPLGGNGFIKTRVAFNASIGLGPADRRSLADWNTMALEAKPSAFPHTELDFGALIWTAYGSRVLTDLGYGKIASVKTNDFDSNPAGCNCLVVEEAFPNATTIVNYSQFDGVSGSVTAIAFQGSDQNYTSVLLDGSKPYGSEREDGWLSRYYRYAVPLGGSIVLIDSIAKHARLSGVHVTEYFYSGDDNTTCSMRAIDSTQTLISNTELEVKPRCRNTQNNALAATVTRISAASLSESVQFTVDGAVSYEIVFGKFDTRKRSRARGAQISDPEVRVFLLLAAPSQSQLPTHGVTKVDCSGDQICFEVAIADDKWRFEFKRDAVGHYLNCVRGADSSGSYSDATCTVYEIDSPVLTPPTNGPTSAAPAANNSPQQFSPGTQNISAATSTDLSAVVLLAALLGVFLNRLHAN